MPLSQRKRGTVTLRTGGYAARNHICHVTTATHVRIRWFSEFENTRTLEKYLSREDKHGHVQSLAFVVVSDHLHWLSESPTSRPFSIAVNNVKSLEARDINRPHSRIGQVWQKGFYDLDGVRLPINGLSFRHYHSGNPR